MAPPTPEHAPPDEHSSTSTPDDNNSTEQVPKKSFFARFKKQKPEDPKQSEEEKKPPPVKFTALFRHAAKRERVLMFFACISAAIHGSLLPVFSVLFGGIIDQFGDVDGSSSSLPEFDLSEITSEVGGIAKWFLILGVVAFFSSFIQVRFQIVVAQRTCARLRRKYFESLMRQDFTWYDENDAGELTARVAEDVNLIQAGIGDKVTSAIQFIAMFVVGVIIAFVYGPLLTLVILSVAPLLILSGAVFGKLAADSTGDQLGAYGDAAAVANEAIGLIRTVTAYNGQETEARRYEAELDKAYKSDVKKSIITGLGLGFTMFVIFCVYAIAFVFGATRVRNEQMSTGDVLTTFFSVIIACISIGQDAINRLTELFNMKIICDAAAPSFQAFVVAQGAAPRVYQVIERDSEIDPLDEEGGEIIDDFKGLVSFENVTFNYKTRETDDVEDSDTRPFVLHNFNIEVPPGTTHALVGESGCGKSTTVRLIERFYDTQEGKVTLDGVDIRKLNVRWLRSQMGYVGQMPTLFARNIRDNIALGAPLKAEADPKTGKTVLVRREVTDDEIQEAAKQANAHDFIMKLPEQYNTMLGERGALLSGGQKQRICIARALVRDPKILILDESTAALDAQSERVVQEALEKVSAGRTTITIAHRLSTVKNADIISVIDKGYVVESGKHADLLGIEGGAYRTLVEHQKVEASKVKDMQAKPDANASEAVDAARVSTYSISKTHQSVKEEETESDEEPDIDKNVLRRAFLYNFSEWYLILIGVIGAALAGTAFPLMAIVFSDVIDELITQNTPDVVSRFAGFFVAIGAGAFVGNALQLSFLGISGERLTRKLRRNAFRTILKQEMGFFDRKENSLGALTTRLATEASLVKGITGDTLGSVSFSISTMLTGFLVAYLACWRVALVVTAVFPFMAIAGALQVKLLTGFDVGAEKRYAQAGAIAGEAVNNVDTVTSLGVQDVFMSRYNDELKAPIETGRRAASVAGVAFGISEFLSQALWAISFWIGSIFVGNGQCLFPDLMKAITGLLFAGMMLGNVATYMPDVAKSKVGATKVFRLLDRISEIDPTVETESKPSINGKVSIKDASFEYPTRPDVPVLRGLSVKVSQGQTLALVGASGCGKSTVVALLERFYDARSGTITIDDTKITECDIKWMRAHLGLVSQEPDLFNCSVRENIAYGLDHTDGTPVTDEMIISAAKAANAHSFITELPDGYETVVGPRGNRLSGGQRQRVAIARAIVREPRLLLLDEATSALDAVSEHVVQEALDKAATGRTTVAIAHRLSTVKNADVIAVMSRGKIIETGRHEQLLRVENGEYANLVKNQLTGDEDG